MGNRSSTRNNKGTASTTTPTTSGGPHFELFLEFPYEVQCLILNYIDVRDLGRLACACKMTKAIVDDDYVWRGVYFSKCEVIPTRTLAFTPHNAYGEPSWRDRVKYRTLHPESALEDLLVASYASGFVALIAAVEFAESRAVLKAAAIAASKLGLTESFFQAYMSALVAKNGFNYETVRAMHQLFVLVCVPELDAFLATVEGTVPSLLPDPSEAATLYAKISELGLRRNGDGIPPQDQQDAATLVFPLLRQAFERHIADLPKVICRQLKFLAGLAEAHAQKQEQEREHNGGRIMPPALPPGPPPPPQEANPDHINNNNNINDEGGQGQADHPPQGDAVPGQGRGGGGGGGGGDGGQGQGQGHGQGVGARGLQISEVLVIPLFVARIVELKARSDAPATPAFYYGGKVVSNFCLGALFAPTQDSLHFLNGLVGAESRAYTAAVNEAMNQVETTTPVITPRRVQDSEYLKSLRALLDPFVIFAEFFFTHPDALGGKDSSHEWWETIHRVCSDLKTKASKPPPSAYSPYPNPDWWL